MLHVLLFLFWELTLPPFAFATWTCSVPHNTTIVHDAISAQVQFGSASELKGGFAEPWPLKSIPGKGQLRLIPYCYADAATRSELHCVVMGAFSLWARRLRFPANAENGHSLAWREASDGNPDPSKRKIEYCFMDYKDPQNKGTWNPAVADETLVIYHDPSMLDSHASVGYEPIRLHPSFGDFKIPGRHELKIGQFKYDTPEEKKGIHAVTAHEIGHVLGMVHEQHRNDRDEYVKYQCEKVGNFDTALSRAIADGVSEAVARNKLCDDTAFAQKYDFWGWAFTKNDRHSTDPGVLDEGEFDVNSIMLYSSTAFAGKSSLCELAPSLWKDACPLLKWTKVNGVKVGTELIHEKMDVSDGDVRWVKKYYPWVGGSQL